MNLQQTAVFDIPEGSDVRPEIAQPSDGSTAAGARAVTSNLTQEARIATHPSGGPNRGARNVVLEELYDLRSRLLTERRLASDATHDSNYVSDLENYIDELEGEESYLRPPMRQAFDQLDSLATKMLELQQRIDDSSRYR